MLYIIWPLPECVALLLNAPVTVKIFPLSAIVPDVKVRFVIVPVPAALINVACVDPPNVSVPVLLFTTTFANGLVMVPSFVQL